MYNSVRKVMLAAAAALLGVTMGWADNAPVRGMIRVKLQPELLPQVGTAPRMQTMGTLSTGITPLDRASRQVKATTLRPMLPYSERFAEARAKYGLDRWYVVEFDESVSPDEARRIYGATAGIERSEVITPMVLREGDGAFVTASAPVMAATSSAPFNDPRLPDQWHYQNLGNRTNLVAGADINLYEAWKVTTGSPDVIVAVIDGGIDYKHEDLAANMFVNEKELNGTPGVDDDGNGWVDDIYGYNFCTNQGDVYPHQHGTHVAGTVAAVNNNGIGVAGVAGGDGTPGSGVKLLSCQVFDPRSGTADGDFARAFVYACEMGATIAQCSWGWGSADYKEEAVLDAIAYFTETARSNSMTGGLAIFAAGNYGETGNWYPACMDQVVAVGAMTGGLMPASYSNYGEWVDIIAPGGELEYDGGVLSTLPNNAYGYLEGTSMATPHVSGIAALILSKHGRQSFLNETLRTQLLTSVNDFYGYGKNDRYAGLYGTGYIDAAKALNMGTGEAPQPVADLQADASQDYIDLTWTIPASSDNNVNNHIVYFSTSPFTAASDLSKIESRIVDTKFLSSGDRAHYEITGLQSLTTYYVAIVAVNRWGVASAMSDVKQVTTNAGPVMTVVTPSVTMTANAATPRATGTLTVGNNGEGVLKWSAGKRTVSVQTQGNTRPMLSNVRPYSGKAAGNTIKPMAATAATAEYEAADYPTDICYYDMVWAYIGDSDRSLPNSMAQWFKVDASEYPDGFNLTHIKVDGYNGKNPTIQVYRGDAPISSATLLLDVKYAYFWYGGSLALQEQLYFAPGESFWITVHFDGNQEGYPLGLAVTDRTDVAGYSYMSNDKGKTWSLLSQALEGSPYAADGNNYTWGITARSMNPDWSELIELTPASGTVRSGQTQDITAAVDGTRLVNGSYKFSILLSTNEGSGRTVSVPASLSVSGNPHDVVMPKVVDFGSLLVGQSKTVSVEAYNRGFGSFRGSEWGAGVYSEKISSSSESFIGPDYLQAGFPARSKTRFEVTFAPTSAGSHSGVITFTDADGKTVRLLVQGSATEPAKLAVEPAVIDAGTLTVGDEPVVKTFDVTNTGKYPLEFVFPRFSDENIEGATAANHRFGYTVASTIEGYNAMQYDGGVTLAGGTDIASKFSDAVYISDAVSLGFQFPYYGVEYDKVYISSYGALMFALPEEGMNFWNPLTPSSATIAGTGMIAAYGNKLDMGANSHVTYAKQDGKFIVKYENVLATVYGDDKTPVSFHIILSANGDIEIHYDSYDPTEVFQAGTVLFCGINDPAMDDCLTVTSADMADYWGTEEPTADNSRYALFGSGTAVRFEAPKASFVTALTPAHGLLAPGETVKVNAILQANATLNAGATYNNLAIVTNDPAPALSAVRINAVIAGDQLVAVASLERDEIALGNIFRTASVLVPVTVRNTGHDVLTVTGVTQTNDAFTYSLQLPVEIPAGLSKDIMLTVPTATEGAVNDVMTITTNVGTFTATITGTVIGCPGLDLSFESVEATLASGTPLVKTLTVKNDGNETLTYAVTPNAMFNLTVPAKADSRTSYAYASATDDPAVKFDWIDVETNGLGTHHALGYYLEHDYVEVELPFEFPFYGHKYNKMYVYNTGFVSFTQRNDDKIWPEPPGDFPDGTIYNNLIAPYWGLHAMDQTATAGTYYYVTDDRAVVSFMEYGNAMNLGVCFQVVMYRDGKFRFQYKGNNPESEIYGLFGLAGISNDGATEGIRLPERMVKFNNAVEFSPVVENSLKPGESDQVTMEFDTNRMGGMYTGSIRVSTNVPGRETVDIPVMLNIEGVAMPVFPDEPVVVEHTVGYQDTNYNDPLVQLGASYGAYFTVANEGTADFTILQMIVEGPTNYDEWMDEYTQAFMLCYEASELDWETGQPTGNYAWMPYDGYSPIQVGSRPVPFGFPMLDYLEQWVTPGEYEIKVSIVYHPGSMMELMQKMNDDDFDITEEMGMAEVTVKFIVTMPPQMALGCTEVYVKATSDDFTTVEKVNISNWGEYKLTYSLVLDPTGVGDENGTQAGGDDPGIMPLDRTAKAAAIVDPTPVKGNISAGIVPAATSANAYDAPQGFDYTDCLYYPAMPGTRSVYNFGAADLYQEFSAATTFTAPDEGFNISHIYAPVTIWNTSTNSSAQNVDIRVRIIKGTDPEGTEVLGRGRLHLASQATNQGSFHIIPLNRSVYMEPGEEFTVVMSFPVGVELPMFLVAKEEALVEGRYMAWRENYGWLDIASLLNDAYGSLGWIMSCVETVKGESWIKLLSPDAGVIDPDGGETDIEIAINAAMARKDYGNTAMLVIKSNDLMTPVVNLPIVLDRNAAPVIEGSDRVTVVNEGDKATVRVTVQDYDIDNFAILFNDPSGIAAITSVEPAEGELVDITVSDGAYIVSGATEPVTVAIEIAPEHGTAGTGYSYTVTAVDEQGHEDDYTGRYVIEHVNRAPITIDALGIEVGIGQVSAPVDFTALFSDPDGDTLTYDFAMATNPYVDAYTTATGVLFVGKKEGTVNATVTATDPSGATCEHRLSIVVSEAAGIDDVTADDTDTEVYYNLQGIRVENPAPGYYLVKRGLTVTKEYVK